MILLGKKEGMLSDGFLQGRRDRRRARPARVTLSLLKLARVLLLSVFWEFGK